ncbi:hypothetical protein, partial [Aeromonas schubertii]|uniref:hypothetical protein n=2 Tax=Aeromonas schubertii TaxID=652 RepID=UPI001E56D451
LKNSAICIATGVAFYASRPVSQALFFKAFSPIDRLAAVAALPCRRRRIIGSSVRLARGNLQKNGVLWKTPLECSLFRQLADFRLTGGS